MSSEAPEIIWIDESGREKKTEGKWTVAEPNLRFMAYYSEYRRADLNWLPVSPDEAANWIINEMGEHYAALLQNALEYRL